MRRFSSLRTISVIWQQRFPQRRRTCGSWSVWGHWPTSPSLTWSGSWCWRSTTLYRTWKTNSNQVLLFMLRLKMENKNAPELFIFCCYLYLRLKSWKVKWMSKRSLWFALVCISSYTVTVYFSSSCFAALVVSYFLLPDEIWLVSFLCVFQAQQRMTSCWKWWSWLEPFLWTKPAPPCWQSLASSLHLLSCWMVTCPRSSLLFWLTCPELSGLSGEG